MWFVLTLITTGNGKKKKRNKNSPTRKTAVLNTSKPITATGALCAVLKLVQIKQRFLVEQVFTVSTSSYDDC